MTDPQQAAGLFDDDSPVSADFTVEITEPLPATTIVHLTGELDLATAPELRTALEDSIRAGRRVVVDASELGFCAYPDV